MIHGPLVYAHTITTAVFFYFQLCAFVGSLVCTYIRGYWFVVVFVSPCVLEEGRSERFACLLVCVMFLFFSPWFLVYWFGFPCFFFFVSYSFLILIFSFLFLLSHYDTSTCYLFVDFLFFYLLFVVSYSLFLIPCFLYSLFLIPCFLYSLFALFLVVCSLFPLPWFLFLVSYSFCLPDTCLFHILLPSSLFPIPFIVHASFLTHASCFLFFCRWRSRCRAGRAAEDSTPRGISCT